MLTENAISISAGRGFTAELKCAHVGYGAASHTLWLKIARWPYAAVLNISGWTQERSSWGVKFVCAGLVSNF